MSETSPADPIDSRAPGSSIARGEGELPGQSLVVKPEATALDPRNRNDLPSKQGPSAHPQPLKSNAGDAYLDIVWKQFRRNRLALWSLWTMAPVIGVAIFAPLLASNVPFVYANDQEIASPWLHMIFNPGQTIDYLFNMAMIGFPVWVVAAVVYNFLARRKHRPGRIRVIMAGTLYLVVTGVIAVIFAVPSFFPAESTIGKLSIDNRYRSRTFTEEELLARADGKSVWSLYPPIPFGPLESHSILSNQQPLTTIDTIRVRPAPKAPSTEPSDPAAEAATASDSDPEASVATAAVNSAPAAGDSASESSPSEGEPIKAKRTRTTDGVPRLLGTDSTGKDVLTKMIYGTRIALSVGVLAVGLYCIIGIVLGALAGYFGHWTDVVISRAIEIVIVFPTFFLILTLVALLNEKSVFLVMLVIGLTGWTTIARLIRGDVLKQRSMEYALGARAMGARDGRILFRHILPNAMSSVLVAIPFGVAGAIILEANLSLLGLGVQVPNPSWGELLNQGRTNFNSWWLIVFPGLAIFFTMTVFNLIGSGLRDAADPRLRGL